MKPVTVIGGGGNESPQSEYFMAAEMRLPEGGPWKEKVTKELQISSTIQEDNRQWVRKTNTKNCRKWLLIPEGAGPFEFGRINKAFGYSTDVTQRNMPLRSLPRWHARHWRRYKIKSKLFGLLNSFSKSPRKDFGTHMLTHHWN